MNSGVRLMFLFLVIYRRISYTLYIEYDSGQQSQACWDYLMAKMSITLSASTLILLPVSCEEILQTRSASKTSKLLLSPTFSPALRTQQIPFQSPALRC